ncbi:MAG: AAA family ATPase [Clostridiales bacterium]|nr:AAA family ATPase [Clostridiales bacterium]
MIYGINIVNFDVFDNDRVGILIDEASDVTRFRLRGLNALIGRNNTGKSSFINSMSFLKDTVTDNVAGASTSRGRPGFFKMLIDSEKPALFRVFFKVNNPEIKASEYLQYELEISAGVFKSPIIKSERLLKSVMNDGTQEIISLMDITDGKGTVMGKTTAINDHHLTALGVYGKITEYQEISLIYHEINTWFFCKFSSDEQGTGRSANYFAEGNAPGGHKHLNSHGTNLDNVLEYLRNYDSVYYDRCINEIHSLIPVMKKKKNLPDNLTESPDRLFLYLLMLRDPNPKSTIFIEAPDKDLYHDMVDVLANEFRGFTIRHRYSQIIFSTHNPYIVETMSPKEIWVFTRTFETERGDVTMNCAAEDPLVRELFEQGVGMGAIWYGGHLDERTGYEDEN